VRFRAEIRRTARRVRTRGAVVEVVYDEGRLLAAGSTQRIREMEFALLPDYPRRADAPAAWRADREVRLMSFGLLESRCQRSSPIRHLAVCRGGRAVAQPLQPHGRLAGLLTCSVFSGQSFL
jgi:hypothetical protein